MTQFPPREPEPTESERERAREMEERKRRHERGPESTRLGHEGRSREVRGEREGHVRRGHSGPEESPPPPKHDRWGKRVELPALEPRTRGGFHVGTPPPHHYGARPARPVVGDEDDDDEDREEEEEEKEKPERRKRQRPLYNDLLEYGELMVGDTAKQDEAADLFKAILREEEKLEPEEKTEDMRFLQSFVELAKAENLLHEGKPLAPHVEQAFKHLERSLRWKDPEPRELTNHAHDRPREPARSPERRSLPPSEEERRYPPRNLGYTHRDPRSRSPPPHSGAEPSSHARPPLRYEPSSARRGHLGTREEEGPHHLGAADRR